jgi:hypothetical protein
MMMYLSGLTSFQDDTDAGSQGSFHQVMVDRTAGEQRTQW